MKIGLHTNTQGGIGIYVPTEFIEAFKQCMIRGCSTWQNVPPEIDEFVQLLQHGKVIQTPFSIKKQDSFPSVSISEACSDYGSIEPSKNEVTHLVSIDHIVLSKEFKATLESAIEVPFSLKLPPVVLTPELPVENFVGMNLQVDTSIPEGQVVIRSTETGEVLQTVTVQEAVVVLYEDADPPRTCKYCSVKTKHPCDLELSSTCEYNQ